MKHFAITMGPLAAVAAVTLVLSGNAGAHVLLLAPNGGEEVQSGTVVSISWQVAIPHNTENWDLCYSTTGANGPWIAIAMDLPPGDISGNAIHTYDWTVPATVSDQCRVRVRMDNSGTDYEDISDTDFSIVGPAIVSADSFSIATGSVDSGGLPELMGSDDQYLIMDPTFTVFRYELAYTVDATSSTDTPSALEFNYESKTFNIIGTVEQKIELFNYDTQQYETVDTRNTTPADSVVTVTPTGDPGRFVETGTSAMRARISYQNSASFWIFVFSAFFLPLESSVDHIFWIVTP